jgi:cytochrome c oxidase assembly factor CtaG
MSAVACMYAVGIVELAVGVAILGAAPVIGTYAASAWLLLVAANLALGGYIDVAVRDVVMSVAAFCLARLLELRAQAEPPSLAATTRGPAIA